MSPINPTSLFHFTEELKTLKLILRNGLRFSFCIETYPGTLSPAKNGDVFDAMERLCFNKVKVAIPMICFCDIPLSRIWDHLPKFGHYGIGLNKQKMCCDYNFKGILELNPLMYIYSDSPTSPLNDLCSAISEQTNDKDKESLKRILGFCKPYDNRHIYPSHDEKYRCFYDEREWRLLYPDKQDSIIGWLYSYKNSDIEKAKDKHNEELHQSDFAYMHLWGKTKSQFPYDFINHIIVNQENEIPEIAEFILDETNPIFGLSKVTRGDRATICSKVTSLERIKNDY